MNLLTVVHFQGLLSMLLGVTMLAPLLISLYFGEGDATAFAFSILISVTLGLAAFLPRRGRIASVSRREAFATVGLGWIVITILGGLPYLFSGSLSTMVDAAFETMSGFTTTGSSVIADIEALPHGILFWRSFTQWLGGVGMIVLFVAIFPILGVGAVQLFDYEAPGPPTERLTPRIHETAKALWLIYCAISVVSFLALIVAGMGPFDAVNHMFTAMATGGFSTKNNSIIWFNSVWVELVLTLTVIAAGVNFGLYYYSWRRNWRHMLKDTELRFYLFIIAATTAIIAADLVTNRGMTLFEGIRYSWFQTATIQTTTGYASADFNLWPTLSQAILLMLMLIGPSSGSTGGAMKVIRIWMLLKIVYREIQLAFHPRVVITLKLAGKPVSEKMVSEVLGFSVLYILVLFGATLFLTAYNLDLVTSFSAVACTLGNVGPGLGAVGPMSNFSQLPDAVKLMLTFCMCVGRLELWTIFVLFHPDFWRTR